MLMIGKIIGALVGYWLGGVYGGLAGFALGAVADYFLSPGDTSEDFAVKVIALGAKMAKADGVVTPDEIVAFKEYFQIPKSEVKNVAKVFNMAKRDVLGYEEYARQLVKLSGNDRQVLESILDGLFYIANADNILHPGEEEFLRSVAKIFGLSDADFTYLLGYHSKSLKDNPYGLLGVSPDISDEALDKHHKTLVKKYHPDVLAGSGACKTRVAELEKKLSHINAAMDDIRKSRKAL